MFTFAKFARIMINATKQSNEDAINDLLGCIIKPLQLRDKNGGLYYLDKSECSFLINGKRDLAVELQRNAGEEQVIQTAETYYSKYILPKIISFLVPDMLETIIKEIANDATISEKMKSTLLDLAKEESLAKLLSMLCLYTVTRSNKESIDLQISHNLPERNRYFSGRVEQLEGLDAFLRDKKNEAVKICQTVSGLGGIGKTQLSIEYAYRYGYKYKNCIWFINAENAQTIYSYFYEFAQTFHLMLPQEFQLDELQNAVRAWLSSNRDWLLILDNMESFDDIRDYLPDKIHGRLLITTRNTRINFGETFFLGVFEEEEAIHFLIRRFSGIESTGLEYYAFDDFQENSLKLIKRLGYLPLALEQAAAYIKEVKCSIAHYLSLLDESGTDAFEDSYAMPQYYESVVAMTWNISFQALEESARQMLNLCAYMAPEKIPVSFFVEMRDMLPQPLRQDLSKKLSVNRVVTSLRIYSLVTGNSEYLNIHRLVQEVIRKKHEAECREF